MKKFLTILILLISFWSGLFASVGRTVTFYGPKKAAMGGTGVAVVDKRESLYYNPAHVVDIDNTLCFPLIQGSLSYGPETISNLSKLSLSGDTNDIIDSYRKIIPSKFDFGYSTNGQWVNNMGSGSLGIGMYSATKIGAKIQNRISPEFDAIGYSDLVFPTLTYGFHLDSAEDALFKNTKIGFTVKNINRVSLYDPESGSETLTLQVLNLIDPNNSAGLNVRMGHGVGLDIGALADMDTFMGPAKVGLVVLNISTRLQGIEFQNMNSDSAKLSGHNPYTQDIPMLGTVGLALKASPFIGLPVLDNLFPDATYASDLDFITQDRSVLKRIHLGMEQTYFNEFIAWRLGLNQGYPTMGINFNFGWAFHLGLTYYTEEFGQEIGDNPQSFYMLDGGFYW